MDTYRIYDGTDENGIGISSWSSLYTSDQVSTIFAWPGGTPNDTLATQDPG